MTLSHCSLTIRLESLERKGNLHIICLGPERIHAPVQWTDADINISLTEKGHTRSATRKMTLPSGPRESKSRRTANPCLRWRAEDWWAGSTVEWMLQLHELSAGRVSNRVDDESLVPNASAGAQDAKAPSSAAVPGPTRIRSLDVLRGVGVLGMLATHIQLFAYPSLARWNPNAYGDLQGVNWWVWLATSVLADGKFIAIFAMLLGASIVMLPGRASDRATPVWRVHMRRMAALLVLGLLHAYLLWYGDMLVPLALCGAVVFFARRLTPRWLLVLGGLAFAAGSVLTLTLTWSLAQGPPDALAAWKDHYTPRRVNIGRRDQPVSRAVDRADAASGAGGPRRSIPGTSSPASSGR